MHSLNTRHSKCLMFSVCIIVGHPVAPTSPLENRQSPAPRQTRKLFVGSSHILSTVCSGRYIGGCLYDEVSRQATVQTDIQAKSCTGRHSGKLELPLYSSLASALDECGRLTPRPGRFSSRNYPARIVHETGWDQGRIKLFVAPRQ